MMSETRSGPRIVEVEAGDAGQRIDNFLLRELRGVPRSRIYGLLRRGEVRVNGGRVRPPHRLAEGDRVRIPPVRLDTTPRTGSDPALRARIGASVIFEDELFLAINKPTGVAAHGGSGVSAGAIEVLRELRPDARLELVHRLDRDTSGVLLFARRGRALRAAHAAFARSAVTKIYRARVVGRWPRRHREIGAPLLRYLRGNERMVRVDSDGRPALTRFRIVDQDSTTTLLDVEPDTGRTHQIRVHAAHGGCPIVGDQKYGKPGGSRLMLHAWQLHVPLPELDRELQLVAELPEGFAESTGKSQID